MIKFAPNWDVAESVLSKIQRVQLRRAKGWQMPPNTAKVDRSTKWGNPFRQSRRQNKAYCVQLFKYLMAGFVCMCDVPTPDEQIAYRKMLAESIGELRGKNLACWCRQDEPCHADVLLRIANEQRMEWSPAAP